jgi:hypothetical protein
MLGPTWRRPFRPYGFWIETEPTLHRVFIGVPFWENTPDPVEKWCLALLLHRFSTGRGLGGEGFTEKGVAFGDGRERILLAFHF